MSLKSDFEKFKMETFNPLREEFMGQLETNEKFESNFKKLFKKTNFET